jgi:hypothetical protein
MTAARKVLVICAAAAALALGTTAPALADTHTDPAQLETSGLSDTWPAEAGNG